MGIWHPPLGPRPYVRGEASPRNYLGSKTAHINGIMHLATFYRTSTELYIDFPGNPLILYDLNGDNKVDHKKINGIEVKISAEDQALFDKVLNTLKEKE